MSIVLAVTLVVTSFSPAAADAEPATPVDAILVDATLVEPRWILDIKYATTDNFTKKKLYPVARCLLRPEVAEMLKAAQIYLDEHHPGRVLVLKDCYRPVHVQKIMWQAVVSTPMQGYVADPNSVTGSVHNYGCAVDVSLASNGEELDMGTPYDHLGILSQPRHETRFLREGKLTADQVHNRHLLREAMTKGGNFRMIRNEWWHFDAWQGAELRRRYQKLDLPLDVAAPVSPPKPE